MAVVGNVGTYAQVQPIQGPDFGGMVKVEFDKLDAEKKAKAAAKAKADKEKQEELDKLTLPSVKTSNITEMNRQSEAKYRQMYSEYVDKVNAGDINGARQIISSVGSLNNAIQFFNDKYKEVTSAEGKYNPQFLTQFEDVLRNINDANSDIEYKGNGLDVITIYKDPEKKEVLVKGNLNEILNSINVPFKFDGDMLNKSVGSFVKTFKPDKIETIVDKGSLYGTKSVEDSLTDPEINDELRRQAKNMVSDRNTRALYAQEKGMSLFQIDNFDETQKKDAEDYFYKIYKDALKKEIDLSIARKSGGGGGGGKDGLTVGTPTLWESSSITTEKPGSTPGKTSVSTVPITPGKAKSLTISSPSGKTLLVNSMPLDRVLYDSATNKMYIGIAFNESGGQSMGSDGSGARESVSNKVTKWYPQDSTEFNAFKTVYNAAFKTELQTIEDFKNALFVDPRM